MNDLNFDSIGVLAYIIKCCAKFNYFINYTKAQKLLYCCYGVILAQFNIRLTKEHPKAWQYGPVFPRAFNAQHKNKIDLAKDPILSDQCPPEVRYLVYETVRHFGSKSAETLSRWSHEAGSPWCIASDNGINLYKELDDNVIRQYFLDNVIDTKKFQYNNTPDQTIV